MSQILVTGEAKIRDIQGPVVSNSGVITALDGDASQYVRGDGTLADFPTSTGGGSSVSYYLNSSVSQGTIGGVAYRQLSKTPISGAGTDIAISTTGYVASYITDANDPALLEVPAGNFNCEFYFSVNSNAHNPYVYAELYKYDGTTFTLLGSNVAIPEYLTNGTTLSAYYFAIPVAVAALTVTDRIAIRIYVNVDGRTVTLHTENNHLCQVVTTFSKGLISLNNLTRQNQFFATGTSGTDFAIVSSVATHTFNLPVASATNTGKLSSTDWSTFNGKVPYTGATTNVDLGVNYLKARTFYAEGNGGGGSYAIKNGATPSFEDGYTILSSNDYRLNILSTVSTVTKAVYLGFSGVTATRTFTLPDITGTLALLEGSQTFSGAKTFSGLTSFTFSSGTRMDYGPYLTKGSVPTVFSGSTTNIYSDVTTNNIVIRDTSSIAKLLFNNSTQTYTFPAATGTLALTSDLSAYLPLAGGTLTGALSGTSATFSGNVRLNAPSSGTNKLIFGIAATDYYWIEYNDATGDIGYFSKYKQVFYGGAAGTTQILSLANNGAATFSSSVTATSESSLFKEGFIVKATTTGGGGSQPAYTYYTAAGSKRWSHFLNVGDDKFFIANASNTEVFTIQQNGNVGIGIAAPSSLLHLQSATATGTALLMTSAGGGTALTYRQVLNETSQQLNLVLESNHPMAFWTNSTERMRITSGGFTKISNTGTYNDVSASYHEFYNTVTGTATLVTRHVGATPYGIFCTFSVDPNNTTSYLFQGYSHNAGLSLYTIWSNGTVSGRSDIRLKKNIIDSTPKLDKLMQLRVVNYEWKESIEGGKEIGLIAQEVEEIFPNLVITEPIKKKREIEQEDGTIVEEEYIDGDSKSVKNSVLPYITIKALQELTTLVKEQQAQIEELKALINK